MAFVLLAAFFVGFLIWSARVNELFCVSMRDGRVLVVRGRVPPGLLADFRDVARSSAMRRGTLRAVKESGGARLLVSGSLDEGQAQRMRNVFGLYPVSRLRAAPAVARPTLGQILGIAWLAWLQERR